VTYQKTHFQIFEKMTHEKAPTFSELDGFYHIFFGTGGAGKTPSNLGNSLEVISSNNDKGNE
jgi:hypothetical protein